MSITKIPMTHQQYGIMEQVMKKIDQTATFLAELSHEERLDWLRQHQYCRPINFRREIGGTIYTVNAHFNEQASESVEEKTRCILSQ